MEWQGHKARFSELGLGPSLLCLGLSILMVVYLVNCVVAWQLGNEMIDQGIVEASIVHRKMFWTFLSPIFLLIAASMLYMTNSRLAPWVAACSMVYVSFGAFFSLVNILVYGDTYLPTEFWKYTLLDIVPALIVIVYVFTSVRIAEQYGLRLRQPLGERSRHFWTKLRGRTTTTETEPSE